MLHLQNERVHLSSNKEDLSNFTAQTGVAACVMNAGGKILLLQNKEPDVDKHLWGVPGGKLNKAENPLDGVIREVQEETGILLAQTAIEFVIKLYVRVPRIDYEFFAYKTDLMHRPNEFTIKLDDNEHIDYKWVNPEDALAMDLIYGGRELLNYMFSCYQHK